MYMTQTEIMDLINLRCPFCNKTNKLMEANMTVTINGFIYIDCKHCGKQTHLKMELSPMGIEENEWRSQPAKNVKSSKDAKTLSELFN